MDLGIKECSKCENNIRCTECSYPHKVEDMRAEIAKLKDEVLMLSQKRTTFPERIELVNNARENAIKEYKVKLIYEIVNTPTHKQENGLSYLNGVAIRQNEIIDIILGVGAKMDGDVG